MARKNSPGYLSLADVNAHNRRLRMLKHPPNQPDVDLNAPKKNSLDDLREALAPEVKPAKYRNVKVKDADGFTYDSRKEERRYRELKMLEESGVVREVKRQQSLGCYSACPRGQPAVHVCDYVADFVYFEVDQASVRLSSPNLRWHRVVEDVKSEATRKNRVYRLKAKLVEAYYGLKIREI